MYKSFDMAGPGPGKYNTLKPFGRDGIKYTMRIKYKRSSSTGNFGYPGPGAYATITKINPNGTFTLSKHENVHPVDRVRFGLGDWRGAFHAENELVAGVRNAYRSDEVGRGRLLIAAAVAGCVDDSEIDVFTAC